MSAYDSVHCVDTKLRVRVYVELPVTHDDNRHAVVVQLADQSGDQWGQTADLSPRQAREIAAALTRAADRFERLRDG